MVEVSSSSFTDSEKKPRVLLVYRRYTSSFLGYAWMLAQGRDVVVDAIAIEKHLIKHSVWIDRFISVQDEDAFLDTLCDVLSEGSYDHMLCVDEPARSLVLGASDREALRDYLPFSPESNLAEVAINKVAFNEWCESNGLSIPRSVVCQTAEAICDAVSELGFPCVLKSAHGSGGREVRLLQNSGELDAAISERQSSTEYIVQEYLDGVVGTSIFVARGGRLYAHCSVENLACTSHGLGPTAICGHVESPELEQIIQTVACHVDGITGFDWLQRPDGSYALIDPHFGRVAPTAVALHLFGVDFGSAYVASISGAPYRSVYEKQCTKVWVFPQFFQLLFESGFGAAWRAANPFSRAVKVYFCGQGEWRMTSVQFYQYLKGQMQVVGGRWRSGLFGRKNGFRDDRS